MVYVNILFIAEKGFLIKTEKKKIIFLDRDGVINHDHGYVYEIEKFHFIDGVFEACKYFINLGYEIIISTIKSELVEVITLKKIFLN